MATTRTATTRWEGSLTDGGGTVTMESSGVGSYDVTWAARAEQPDGKTSPEELIAAAHSSCFSMALSAALSKGGTPPQALDTKADVTFVAGTGITGIHLTVVGTVEGIERRGLRLRRPGSQGELPGLAGAAGHDHHARRVPVLTLRSASPRRTLRCDVGDHAAGPVPPGGTGPARAAAAEPSTAPAGSARPPRP